MSGQTRVIIAVLMGTTLIPAVKAQSDSTKTILTDSVTLSQKHSGYFAGGYGNNLVYLGSSISGNQPFSYASMIYGFKGEFFVSLSAFHLSNNSPIIPLYCESLSYSHEVNSWFDYAVSLSGYQADKVWADTIFDNFFYGDITIGFDWKILYTKLSIGGLHADDNNIFFQICNSRYFETNLFDKGKLSISFDPYVNTILGMFTSVEPTSKSAEAANVLYNLKVKKTNTSSRFGLLELDIGLPFAINSDRATLEVEPGYIISINSDDDMPETKGFSLFISAYFKIF